MQMFLCQVAQILLPLEPHTLLVIQSILLFTLRISGIPCCCWAFAKNKFWRAWCWCWHGCNAQLNYPGPSQGGNLKVHSEHSLEFQKYGVYNLSTCKHTLNLRNLEGKLRRTRRYLEGNLKVNSEHIYLVNLNLICIAGTLNANSCKNKVQLNIYIYIYIYIYILKR